MYDDRVVSRALTFFVFAVGAAVPAANAQKMYWADAEDQRIQRANLDGSNVEDLVLSTTAPCGAAFRLGVSGNAASGQIGTDVSGKRMLADCNENGVEDADDIGNLTSPDCNANTIPDECEIQENSIAPGSPFFCDPGAPPGGLAQCDPDCNRTGVPDECELTENDCNFDGRPDECGVTDECLFGFMTAPTPLNRTAAFDVGGDLYPQLTTDGHGVWLAVWSSEDHLGGTIGTDYDILCSRSTDNGASWTAPSPVNTNAAFDTGDDVWHQLTTDGRGNWLVVWSSDDDLAGTIGTDEDILFARSADIGASWTAPSPVNTNATSDFGDDDVPELTTDGQGAWLAVWLSGDDLGGTIGTDDDILFSRTADIGASWSAPSPVGTNAASDFGDDTFPSVTTDGRGIWLAVWATADDLGGTIGTDYDVLVARSTDNGTTWTAPAPLHSNAASDSGTDWVAQITTDGQGNWLAVWLSFDDLGGTIGTDGDILVARSTDNGTNWTIQTQLNSNAASDSGSDYRPQLTTDGRGNWLAVWESKDDLSGTIGRDEDILFARSTDDGANWTVPAPLNTNAASFSGDADQAPQLTTDGRGNWLTVWHSRDDLDGVIEDDRDILLSRFHSVGDDCNCNTVSDRCEFPDCNKNCVPDDQEISEGTSEDCDEDGVPDECEPDCNENGVADDCDIAGETSADCQGNAIPDECDIASGISQDVNGNEIPDVCDPVYKDDCNLAEPVCQNVCTHPTENLLSSRWTCNTDDDCPAPDTCEPLAPDPDNGYCVNSDLLDDGPICSQSAADCYDDSLCRPYPDWAEVYRCFAETDNRLASTDGPAAGGGCFPSYFAADVWQKVISPCTGILVVDQCRSPLTYDAMLAVFGDGTPEYAETACPITTNADLLMCNDDFCPGSATVSGVQADVEKDGTYLLRIGGWSPDESDVHADQGSTTVNVGFICPVPPPVFPPELPADPMHQAPKNRYVSLSLSTSGNGRVAYEVTLSEMYRCSSDDRRACSDTDPCPNICAGDSNLQCTGDAQCGGLGPCVPGGPCVAHGDVGSVVGYVGVPYTRAAVPNSDLVGQFLANIVPAPVYRVWTEDVVHVTACEIVPAAQYEWRAVDVSYGTRSDPLTKGTIGKPAGVHYGDVVGIVENGEFTPPQGVVSVTDISAYLIANQGGATAPHTTWVDLHGTEWAEACAGDDCTIPQAILSVSDLGRIKFGFIGQTYVETPGHENPGDCP